MTDATFQQPLTSAEINQALVARFSRFALWLGAFLSGFVINEPAPYELYMAALIAVWALAGLRFSAPVLILLTLLAVFNLGGVISMTQMDVWGDAPLYVAVSFFLAGTAVFFAAVVEGDHRRLHAIFYGYVAAAAITAFLGIAGYFHLIPGTDFFLRFGRAKGAFQDPNVFAPFLVLPAIYCLHQVLTRPFARSLVALPLLMVLTIGIFLSFSRAGWGMYALSIFLLVIYLLAIHRSGAFRLRILLLSVFSIVLLAAGLMVALQFDNVSTMLSDRAQLVQDYDGARLGRFARHAIGFKMAMEHPLGSGILQFAKIFGEDQHNVYLKTLFDYSWLGFAAYVITVLTTLGIGIKLMFRPRPWSPYLACVTIVFFGHVLVGYIIDTDHWRHFYLLMGIIWGCAALEIRNGGRYPSTALEGNSGPAS